MNLSPSFKLQGWRAALAVTLAAAAALAACGGGGTDAPAGGTVTPPAAASISYTLGTVSGFGSVVVGGVRYDDSKATVTDEDGEAHSSSDLRLGMTVQINGGRVDRAAGTAVAERVRFGSETVGPVSAVDAAAGTLTLLGQTIVVTANTVFDSSLAGGLTAVTVGMVLEVHGVLDPASGQIRATRVEPKTGALFYRMRGVVSALDTTAKTFKIGSELISYAGITTVPASLVEGAVVRVRLQTTQVAGAWVATRLVSGKRQPDATSEADVEGIITTFTSATAFAIDGLTVDASAASFPDGTAGIELGARVEVEGTLNNGVLMATKVEVEERHNGGRRELELHGAITSLDSAAQTFVLRTVTVSYAGDGVEFRDGSVADLAAGKQVEVHGVLSEDRTRLQAQRIEFKR